MQLLFFSFVRRELDRSIRFEASAVIVISLVHLPNFSFSKRVMDYIDPHIHMVSRTTDDYETIARMGCVALSEPAFWGGL